MLFQSLRVGWWQRLRLSIFCIVAFSLSTQAGLASEISIQGTIRFADGEAPVAAFVSLSGASFHKEIEADAQGNYSFSDVPNGSYDLFVFAGGTDKPGAYRKRDLELTAQTPRPLVLNVVLSTDADEIRQQ